MNNRAGHYKSNLSGEMAYKSFAPNPLPPAPPIDLTEDIVSLLVKANSQLAVLESVVAGILVQTSDTSRNRTFAYETYLDILRRGT